MTTDAQRLPLLPTSADTSWLFWSTLCFGAFLALYAPYRFWCGALQLIDKDGQTLASAGMYFMGLWCK